MLNLLFNKHSRSISWHITFILVTGLYFSSLQGKNTQNSREGQKTRRPFNLLLPSAEEAIDDQRWGCKATCGQNSTLSVSTASYTHLDMKSTCSKTVDEDELKMFLTVLINILNLPGGLYPSNITCNSPKMIPPQMSLFTFMTCAT